MAPPNIYGWEIEGSTPLRLTIHMTLRSSLNIRQSSLSGYHLSKQDEPYIKAVTSIDGVTGLSQFLDPPLFPHSKKA